MEQRFIESCYAPHELQTASAGRRFAGSILDGILLSLLLGVGWLIWLAFSARSGMTPGKQLLGMYVIRTDGSRAGGTYTWYPRDRHQNRTARGNIDGAGCRHRRIRAATVVPHGCMDLGLGGSTVRLGLLGRDLRCARAGWIPSAHVG